MQPLAVWDVREDQWRHRHEEKSEWLRDHGFDVLAMYRAEFYLVDAPFIRVFTYHVNEQGRRHWNECHPIPPPLGHDHSGCGPAVNPPYDQPVWELPPPELLGAAA